MHLSIAPCPVLPGNGNTCSMQMNVRGLNFVLKSFKRPIQCFLTVKQYVFCMSSWSFSQGSMRGRANN